MKKSHFLWMILSIFLMAITILPAFEVVELRYRKKVELSENTVSYPLHSGDVIEQMLIVDKGDRLDDLRIWLSADPARNNQGTLQVTLTQGDTTAESTIDLSRVVEAEYVSTGLSLSRFQDKEAKMTLKVLELDDEASVMVRSTAQAIYGLPAVSVNGSRYEGTLSLSYQLRQPQDPEFLVSLGMIGLIIVVSIAAAYLMTCTRETPQTGWMLIGCFALLAMATYSLDDPLRTWQGESGWEGVTFFYHNVVHRKVIQALFQLEGGMYLSTLQNLLMLIAFKFFHLREGIHIAVQSLSTLFWVMCLAPFCSHYFKQYFNRPFRFVCALLLVCYRFVLNDYTHIGYYGAFFLLLLLIFDFEKIHKGIYLFILLLIPVICTSKMMYVVFAPLMGIVFVLFGKQMNRRKKGVVATIGIASLMEGVLSLLLRHGVQSGTRLGTIQRISLGELINKTAYYTVQVLGDDLRNGLSNTNQLLVNVIMVLVTIGILGFCFYELKQRGKGSYRNEAKMILVMVSLIVIQNAFILLTTTDWHADISWKQSVNVLHSAALPHFTNLHMAAITIYLILLWVCWQSFRPHFLAWQNRLDPSGLQRLYTVTGLLIVGTTFFYVNQFARPKTDQFANPEKYRVPDWPTYASMLDYDRYSIRIAGLNKGWFYCKNAANVSVPTSRSDRVDCSGVVQLEGKEAIVIYAHKTAVTNQILDRAYYASIYDREGNFVIRVKQMNPDLERQFIAFDIPEGVRDIGMVKFTYPDGSAAQVDDTLEIGYQ